MKLLGSVLVLQLLGLQQALQLLLPLQHIIPVPLYRRELLLHLSQLVLLLGNAGLSLLQLLLLLLLQRSMLLLP